jgi:hypothetical protein
VTRKSLKIEFKNGGLPRHCKVECCRQFAQNLGNISRLTDEQADTRPCAAAWEKGFPLTTPRMQTRQDARERSATAMPLRKSGGIARTANDAGRAL